MVAATHTYTDCDCSRCPYAAECGINNPANVTVTISGLDEPPVDDPIRMEWLIAIGGVLVACGVLVGFVLGRAL